MKNIARVYSRQPVPSTKGLKLNVHLTASTVLLESVRIIFVVYMYKTMITKTFSRINSMEVAVWPTNTDTSSRISSMKWPFGCMRKIL